MRLRSKRAALSRQMAIRQMRFDAGTCGTVIRDSIAGHGGIDDRPAQPGVWSSI
jgi:hypothetical protein